MSRTSLLFLALVIAPASLHAAGGHAADDELALAAAQLAPKTSTTVVGAPSGISVQATLVDPAQCSSLGAWGAAIKWTPHIPVSAANLPDGRILTFASNQRTTFPVGPEFTYAATWDPATGTFKEYNNSAHDMFCGGMTLMTDGRVMVNGGRNSVPYTSVFDWRTNTWTRIQSMSGGRWYNTSVSLPNGNVFTATGSGTGMQTTERWSTTGWTLLTGIGWPAVTDPDAGYVKEWHPFVSVAPDGRLLHYGPTDTMHWFNVNGTGAFVNANASIPGVQYPKEGCSVVYDEGKILVAGGGINAVPSTIDSTIGNSTNAAYTVDMSTNPPTVAPTASMQYARQFVNTVVLPSGEVLVIGGNNPGQKFSDIGSVMPCEIWNPKTGTWRTVASISVPRNYHSVALLLPDGRVWSAGGGLGGSDHQDAQLYTPPCLFTSTGATATRPTLSVAPTKIGPGNVFSVTGTAGLVKFAFIRMAALTHSVNTDQRYLSLPFTESSAGTYKITAHSNLNVMTPGYWMLFGIKSDGAYSVAKIIQVDATNTIAVSNPGPQQSSVGSPVVLQMSATAPAGVTITWSASNLPAGLTINATTGVISGSPTTSGLITTRVTASGGGQAVSQDFSWTVLLTNTGKGSVLREWWLNIPNPDLNSLTSNAAYPYRPDGSDKLSTFETPTNWADNMGQRLRGYIIPPVTGAYRFWIASDDESRLILSTNTDPANGSIIAYSTLWASPREWTKYPEQASAFITLQAGQPYYIEALMKENLGGDNLAVAWQIPNTNTPVVIDGQYLSPFQVPASLEVTAPTSAPVVVGAPLNFTPISTGGVNPRFSWNWGDGSAATTSGAHTYAAPGRYLVTLTGSDDTGRIVSASFYQSVHAALTSQRPTVSSSIVFDAASNRVWCVNADNNSISVFDAATRTRIAEIAVGNGPRTLAVAPNGNVWVTNIESSGVSVVSGSSLSVVQTISLTRGARPFGIVFSPSGTDAWVACEGTGALVRFNSSTGAVVGSLLVGSDARHVSVSADSTRVFVTRFITPPMPGESTTTITPSSTSGGEVISVSTSSFAIEKKTFLLHSDRADTISTGRGIPNYLGPAIVSPDGLTAWVPSKQDNIKRGQMRDGIDLTHDQTIRSIASRIPLTSGIAASTDDTTNRVDFDNAGIAVNGAFDPNGSYLFTALEGSREVGVVDIWNKREARRFKAGRAPQGIALSSDGRTVFVHNFMDRTITVHDAGALIDGADTTPTLIATMSCVSTERLSANVLLGKQHFYDSADPRIAFEQYISCASCHNDGGHDGRVWDFTQFGEGLRNTISLRGHGGTAQGPVHWTGNFDEIQDFENQLRSLPHGTGLITGGDPNTPLGTPNAGRSNDLDSLALYVASLQSNDASPSRNSDGSMTASALAGKSQFTLNSCANCHSGSQFTDSAVNVLHDIGTLKPTSGSRLGSALTGLDTPTLRGIWNTAPYLHDGSAATIEAAILAHTKTPHPQASTQAMTDLVNYLTQLDDSEPTSPPALNVTLSSPTNVITTTTFTVNLQFNTSVPNVTNSDLQTTNCTVLGVSGSGANWVATIRAGLLGSMNLRYVGYNLNSGITLSYAPALFDYAFGSAVQTNETLSINGGSVTSTHLRGLTDLQFALESSDDLKGWTVESMTPSTTDLGDGRETTAWTSARRFVRLRVIHSSGSSITAPVTQQRLTLNAGTQTVGISALRAPIYAGSIANVTATTLNLPGDARLLSRYDSSTRYFIEVRDGAYAGHRFDVQTVSDSSLVIDSTSTNNTLGSIPSDLSGANIFVRPHQTLGTAFSASQFQAGTNPNNADQVLLFQNGNYVTYWLFNGGSDVTRRGWVRSGDIALTNRNSLVLAPGNGTMVKIVGGTRTWSINGQVRTNPFLQLLTTGHNLICAPWPLDQSPTTLGLTLPGTATGARTTSSADQLQRWNGDSNIAMQSYTSYWLLDSGTGLRRWITAGDISLTSMDSTLLFAAQRSFFYKAQPATAAKPWFIPMP